MTDVSLTEFVLANKKIGNTIQDDDLLKNSYLNKFNASDELLILHGKQLKTPNASYGMHVCPLMPISWSPHLTCKIQINSQMKSTVRLDSLMKLTTMAE